MKLSTRHFGEIEIDEEKIIYFEKGLPGFFENKRFVMLDKGEEGMPFHFLQSVDDGEVSFAIANPYMFYPTYAPEISDLEVEKLECSQPEELAVYNVLVVPEKIENTTINLKAPIVINSNTKKAAQIISLNKEYGIRHKIYDDMQLLKKTS